MSFPTKLLLAAILACYIPYAARAEAGGSIRFRDGSILCTTYASYDKNVDTGNITVTGCTKDVTQLGGKDIPPLDVDSFQVLVNSVMVCRSYTMITNYSSGGVKIDGCMAPDGSTTNKSYSEVTDYKIDYVAKEVSFKTSEGSVTDPSTGGCSNTILSTDLGLMPSGSGVTYEPFSGPIALHFRVNPTHSVGRLYTIGYENVTGYPVSPTDTTISTCAGDFTASGMEGTKSFCIETASARSGPVIANQDGTYGCLVKPGVDYYINIKATNAGSLAFVLSIH